MEEWEIEIQEIIDELREEGHTDEEIQTMLDRFAANPPKSVIMLAELAEKIRNDPIARPILKAHKKTQKLIDDLSAVGEDEPEEDKKE